MANPLDELQDTKSSGQDARVIQKQIPIQVGVGSKIFVILLWCLAIIPGIIYLIKKFQAENYLRSLEQKIQHDASTIDNYIEQRVVILQNAAPLLEKSIDLDKDVMKSVAAFRSGMNPDHTDDVLRNETVGQIDKLFGQINVALERYPELRSHDTIRDCMQQNSYLQKEITAARDLYNDDVYSWNHAVQQWPVKMIAAAKKGYTTRIPFSTTEEIRTQARGVFF